MSTFFLRKKVFFSLFVFFIYTFIAISLFYAERIKNVQAYDLNQTFYFLVHTNENVEVGAYTVPLNGGAGYLLQTSSGETVAYTVYTKYSDAERGQNNVSDSAIECIDVSTVYFKTKKEKHNAQKFLGVMRSLYGCIEVLQAEINRLSKGATQESSKRVLKDLKGVFDRLTEESEKDSPKITRLCEKTAERLQRNIDGVVYCKDLRYILCDLCFSYVKIASEFSL